MIMKWLAYEQSTKNWLQNDYMYNDMGNVDHLLIY
jgi:hypothetical protein